MALPDPGTLLRDAAHLVGLALAPPFVSPAPASQAGSVVASVVDALLLAALVFAADRARRRIGGREGLAVFVAIVAAVVAALIMAGVFGGERGPLGRGVLYVAVPLWGGLALAASAIAGRVFVDRARSARRVAPAVVSVVAIALFASSASWLFSPEGMWMAALRVDGENQTAVEALTRAPLRARRYEAALAVLDRCLVANPGACACLSRRAVVGMRTRPAEKTIAEALAARQHCPGSIAARATAAEVLGLYGDPEQAEQEARAGLEKSDDARLHYALALALDRTGRHKEALGEAKRAVKLGAGRDSAVLLGSLSIVAGDLDTATEALAPVVAADPDDADAQFDLALVADRKGDFERARQGYLSALRAEPKLAAARYNLALMSLRAGAVEEARRHAERFAASFPDDPRGPALTRTVSESVRR